ncbi:MAG TPA: hypothetical protein VG244_12355 [Acidimicrobiales bacterium]|jgi:hypothetical protein|nr:hypothetical protein [Acidimicrobiales bacterium]
MKTALEEELGAAFAARVATLPPDAAARVRSMDYRPRQHRRAVPVGLGAGGLAGAATAGTVLAVVLGGAAPAYAGWSAAPTSSPASSSAAPDCVSTLSGAGPGSAGTGSGTGSGTGTWQTLLSDVRGPFTITLLQNGTSYATCFIGPSFTEVNRITPPPDGSGGAQSGTLSVSSQTANGDGSGTQGGAGSLVSLEGTSSGDLTQVLQNHLATTADGPYTFIDAQVANGVTGVTLVLRDGQDIVATVADGWFVAWWPGSTDAISAQVTKATGTTSEPFVPVSQMGTKFPLGQAGSTSGVPVPPPPTLGGTCAAPSTTSGSGAPSVDCKPTTGSSGSSGNSGNSGNIATPGKSAGSSGGTGPGPTTDSKP